MRLHDGPDLLGSGNLCTNSNTALRALSRANARRPAAAEGYSLSKDGNAADVRLKARPAGLAESPALGVALSWRGRRHAGDTAP